MALDVGAGALEGNRRPSRLLAAYAKAAERSRQEALVAANPAAAVASAAGEIQSLPQQRKPPVVVVQSPSVAAPARRPAPARARRARTHPIRWMFAVGACTLAVAAWQMAAPRESALETEVTSDASEVSTALPAVEQAAIEPRPGPSDPVAALPVVPTLVAAANVAPAKLAPASVAPASVAPVSVVPVSVVRASVAPTPRAAADPAAPPPTSRPGAGDQWLSPHLAKLRVRPTWRAAAIGVGDAALIRDLQQGLAQVWINHAATNRDVIFLGIHQNEDLARIKTLRLALKSGGVLWVLFPPGDASTAAAIVESARSADLTPSGRVALSKLYDAMSFVDSSKSH